MKVTEKLIHAVCLSMLSASFIGCGGTGQDNGSVSTHNQAFSGVAIDGYLARATVFIDTNNDGTRNGWEPFAFTDDEGYYSFNPRTNTNYCATDATAEQAQYCLRSNAAFSNVVVRIDGGYDISTGEPFAGQMSRRVSNIGNGDVADVLVSPITSLLTDIPNSSDQETVLSALGLTADDLDVDYMDDGGSINFRILNSALKVHKVVTVLADRITDTYRKIGDESGTPNDASSLLYSALANELITSGNNFDDTIADNTALASVLDTAETAVREIYVRQELTLPADMGTDVSPGNFNRVITVASNVLDLVNSIIPAEGMSTNQEQVRGMMRAVESVLIKALDEINTDSSIERMTNLFANPDFSNTIEDLLGALSDPAADLTALARNSFSNPDTLVESAALPQSAMPFTQIGGMRIKVSNLDLGRAPDDLKDSEVEWYFHGDADDLNGTYTACVKHVDGASTLDGSLGEGSTRGTIVTGFWSLLGATAEQIESYSLLITLEFLGSNYQAIIKPAGIDVVNDVTYEKVRFDFDGEVKAWHSVSGFVPTSSIPTSNAECRANLPSRIGV